MIDLVESGRVKLESARASNAAARVCDATATKDYVRWEFVTMVRFSGSVREFLKQLRVTCLAFPFC